MTFLERNFHKKYLVTTLVCMLLVMSISGRVNAQQLVRPEGIVSYFTLGDNNAIVTVNTLSGDSPITQLANLDDITILVPVWSPDGTQIAFTGLYPDGLQSIWLAPNTITGLHNADDSNLINLTPDPEAGSNRDPSWSPDGGRLAFATNRTRFSNFDIWLMNNTGEVVFPITGLSDTNANDVHPAWSPDGNMIAFTSNRAGNDDIWLYSFDDVSVRQLTNDDAADFRPVWSPDSRTIAFVSDRAGNLDIFSLDVTSPEATPINLTEHPADDSWASWSPNGERMVFTSDRNSERLPDPQFALYVMNVGNPFTATLISDAPNDIYGANWQTNPACEGESILEFSTRNTIILADAERDATRLTFCNNTDGSQLYQYAITLKRGSQEPITLVERAHLVLPNQNLAYNLSNLLDTDDIARGEYQLCAVFELPPQQRACETVYVTSALIDTCQHTVGRGETLGMISSRYGVSVRDILDANPRITNANVIVVGQNITIPDCSHNNN